ncbi:YciI family protein [Phenylobacterium sp. LjRoot225]|uniref:YciI family protein n=1 Tax=Phenylobacterium sp. LjRoot225 TaxID=3342285 RepID=UPI003ECF37CF
MPLFVLNCIDKPDALDVRMGAREAHLAYVRQSPVVKIGGPFLDAKGEMAGSMLIIEVADLAAAQAFSAEDPYTKAGLFQSVDVRPFKLTLGSL